MKRKATHKLGLLFVLLSSTTFSAMAQQFPDPCYFGGWSAGIGLGATTFMTNITHNTYAPNVTSQTSGQIYKYGPMGNIFLGYAGVWDNLYLGAELGLNFLGARESVIRHVTQTNNTITVTVPDVVTGTATLGTAIQTYTKVRRNTVEPVLDIKPGVFLAPWGLLYARLGINWNEINIKSNANYRTNGTVVSDLTLPTSASTSTAVTHSREKNITGFRLGLGLEYMLNRNLGIGSDYVYTFYENVSANRTINNAEAVSCDGVTGCTVSSNGVLREHTKAKTADQEVMLQLIYHFNC